MKLASFLQNLQEISSPFTICTSRPPFNAFARSDTAAPPGVRTDSSTIDRMPTLDVTSIPLVLGVLELLDGFQLPGIGLFEVLLIADEAIEVTVCDLDPLFRI